MTGSRVRLRNRGAWSRDHLANPLTQRTDTATGLDHEGVAKVDSVTTIPRAALIRPLGTLVRDQEGALTRDIHAAFDLD